jgi:archaellum component FlaG (FlaF/FlaG flagellin family)
VFIKVLFVVLVLCTIALVGAVAAAYLKIRKHMRDSDKRNEDKNYPGTPSGS